MRTLPRETQSTNRYNIDSGALSWGKQSHSEVVLAMRSDWLSSSGLGTQATGSALCGLCCNTIVAGAVHEPTVAADQEPMSLVFVPQIRGRALTASTCIMFKHILHNITVPLIFTPQAVHQGLCCTKCEECVKNGLLDY